MPPKPKSTPRRIKVSGKPPRGDSKSERILEHWRGVARRHFPSLRETSDDILLGDTGAGESVVDNPRFKSGSTAPSSRRKKVVKEGSRKFIGPRRLRSELSEDVDSRTREANVNPTKYINQERGPGRRGEIYEVDEGGILPFKTSRREMRKFKRLNKEGPSGRKRAMAILERIMDQYLGGGQEFDAQG
jgi:hypothetical protein